MNYLSGSSVPGVSNGPSSFQGPRFLVTSKPLVRISRWFARHFSNYLTQLEHGAIESTVAETMVVSPFLSVEGFTHLLEYE